MPTSVCLASSAPASISDSRPVEEKKSLIEIVKRVLKHCALAERKRPLKDRIIEAIDNGICAEKVRSIVEHSLNVSSYVRFSHFLSQLEPSYQAAVAVGGAAHFPARFLIASGNITDLATRREALLTSIAYGKIEEIPTLYEQWGLKTSEVRYLVDHNKVGAEIYLKKNLPKKGAQILKRLQALPENATYEYSVSEALLLYEFRERGELPLKWIESILALRVPTLRSPLLSIARRASADDRLYERIQALPVAGRQRCWQYCAQLLWAQLQVTDLAAVNRFRERVEASNSRFHDYRFNQPLIKMLYYLGKSSKGIETLLTRMLDQTSSDQEILEQINGVNTLYSLGKLSSLLRGSGMPVDVAAEQTKEILQVQDVDDFQAKFQRTFGSCREPLAITRYAANLHQLYKERPEALGKGALQEYIRNVLNGTFRKERYDTAQSEHLRGVFRHFPKEFAAWKTNLSATLSELLPEPAPIDMKTALLATVATFPQLNEVTSYLTTGEQTRWQEYLEELKRIGKTKAKKRTSEESAKLRRGGIERKIAQIVAQTDANRQLEGLKGLKKQLAKSDFDVTTLKTQVDSLISQLTPNKQGEIKVFETDNPIDLLLCGTEVQGSCQHVSKNARLSVALVGYLLNGRCRLIKIAKKEDGRILARAIIRVISDGERPVVMGEKIYWDQELPKEYRKAIIAMCKRKADSMGVPAVTYNTSGEKYPHHLRIFRDRAPFEYFDCQRGMVSGANAGVLTPMEYLRPD